jgi:hypothetical protein
MSVYNRLLDSGQLFGWPGAEHRPSEDRAGNRNGTEHAKEKEVVAETTLKNRLLKKSLVGHGEEDET